MNQEENNFEEINTSPEIQAQNTIEQEQQAPLESIDVLAVYESKKEEVQEKLAEVSARIESLAKKLKEVRQSLNLPTNENAPSIDELKGEQEILKQEQIKVSSNYPGDWTLLLRERMISPISKEKFIETRTATLPNMKPGEAPIVEAGTIDYVKKEAYQGYYQNQIKDYDQNVERIFNSTHIADSSEHHNRAINLGKGEIGSEGTVFIDAEKRDGTPLSVREKNIIEAHEKGHGLRNFVSEDKRDFTQAIDLDVIREKDARTGRREIGYLRQAEEIAERMAQLKNYFGFKAKDIFTKEHFEYAREHYVKDVGLDNNMTTFFEAVTEHAIDKFIETINKYPL
jgi:hypothetical protein